MLDRLRVIREVHPEQPSRLRIVYDDGQSIVLNFAPIIAKGGVLESLAEWSVFKQARRDARGRSVCWPGEIDFCADALWLEAQSDDQRHAG